MAVASAVAALGKEGLTLRRGRQKNVVSSRRFLNRDDAKKATEDPDWW